MIDAILTVMDVIEFDGWAVVTCEREISTNSLDGAVVVDMTRHEIGWCGYDSIFRLCLQLSDGQVIFVGADGGMRSEQQISYGDSADALKGAVVVDIATMWSDVVGYEVISVLYLQLTDRRVGIMAVDDLMYLERRIAGGGEGDGADLC